jgi:hypothetical protein
LFVVGVSLCAHHALTPLSQAGVDCAIEQGLADADRLGVCGISGGGNLPCWIVGQTDRFKAAIPENPVTNWLSFYGTSGTPTEIEPPENPSTPRSVFSPVQKPCQFTSLAGPVQFLTCRIHTSFFP